MLSFKKAKKFKRDMKKIASNPEFRKDIFEHALGALMSEAQLEERFCVHKLKGEYQGCFECHIQPDVLLIYEVDEEAKKIYLLHIGSHAELFG